MTRSTIALSMAALLGFLLSACGGTQDGPGPVNGTNGSPEPTAAPTAQPGGPCSGDLAMSPADIVIYGAGEEDRLGDKPSIATGDFNGDGYQDILVGAHRSNAPGRLNSGQAYIFYGRNLEPGSIDLATGEGADVVLDGLGISGNFGYAVAAGDVNGDGIDDIIVGARHESEGERRLVGKVYVFYGDRDLPRTLKVGARQQAVTIIGREDESFAGFNVAAGDVTGNGVVDVVIGAVHASGPDGDRERAGEVYVIEGGEDIPSLIDLASEDPFFTVIGAQAHDAIPNSLAVADVTGDGRGEILISSQFASRGDPAVTHAGAVFIVPVPATGGVLDLAGGTGFSSITGGEEGNQFGASVSAGDVTGDGNLDLIIGSREANALMPDGSVAVAAGSVHVFFGGGGLPESVNLAEQTADLTIFGPRAWSRSGTTVMSADIDGDGVADIVIGSPTGDGCLGDRRESGAVYVILGREDFPAEINLAAASPYRSFYGISEGDWLGNSLAAGDITRTGNNSLIVGSTMGASSDGERLKAGQIHVILQP